MTSLKSWPPSTPGLLVWFRLFVCVCVCVCVLHTSYATLFHLRHRPRKKTGSQPQRIVRHHLKRRLTAMACAVEYSSTPQGDPVGSRALNIANATSRILLIDSESRRRSLLGRARVLLFDRGISCRDWLWIRMAGMSSIESSATA